ncbi:MAG: transporter substrate-binding domain-containing protein [Caldilineales bacterium]
MKHHLRSVLVLAALSVLALLLAACGGAAAPTAVPTDTPAPATATPAAPLDALQRVRDSGTMVVAVSADYPPFESYDSNFRLDGFDIALMKAIGEQMGVEIEFNDFAFDGLFGALQLGQADVAISAISVTDERRQEVDFSDVYFISQGVALGSDQKQLDVTPTAENLSGLRVAVEGGTVYESWAKSDLVEQGLLPESNLLVYSDVEQAVRDVKRGLVDVVLMDLQPAQAFEEQGGVTILAEDVTVQRFAIALPKGQDGLRRAINNALSKLQGDNLIFGLAEQYLGVSPDDIVAVPTPMPEPPTPTPAPNTTPTAVPTVAPPAGCVDGMAWVADLSFDDSNMTAPPVVPPGQPFVKSWRVRNSGTCTWNNTYFLGYDHGNVPAASMSGQPVYVQGTVAPGATYDFSANLVAPTTPGGYQGFWQMRNGQGRAFGETVWVGIRVPASAPATPVATQTPVSGINFTSTSNNIQQGQCVTLNWSTNNVQAVYFYQQGQDWQNNGVAGTGSRQECPQQTTTYYLRVVMQDNSVQTRQQTINVTPVGNAPQIYSFSINPTGQIQAGQCVTLQWNVGGASINDIFLSRDNQPLWDGAPYQGTFQDCPPGTGQKTYLLKATGPGGSNQATQSINVTGGQPTNTPVPPPTNTPLPPPTNTPVPPTSTPVPQPPSISSFSAIPDQITLGECVTLSWSFSGQSLAASTITRDGQPIASDVAQNGSQQDCPPNAGTVNYTLQVDSEVGSTSQSDQVNVLEAQQPEQPPQITSFSADPAQIGLNNTCTTLSWSYTGTSIAGVSLSRTDGNGNTAVLSEGDATPPYQDCVDPGLAGQTLIYTLSVDSEFSGSTSQQTTVVFAAG